MEIVVKKLNDCYAFADLQGFKDNANKFIVKEIAIITSAATFHKIVKTSPFIFSNLDEVHRKQARWLTRRHHGLEWSQGSITFRKLRKKLNEILNGKIFYVKGCEKIQWLQEILSAERALCEINDIESVFHTFSTQSESIAKEIPICNEHKALKSGTCCHCALQNALILKQQLSK